jgi:nucleotide-binding universal stress UspA family protein
VRREDLVGNEVHVGTAGCRGGACPGNGLEHAMSATQEPTGGVGRPRVGRVVVGVSASVAGLQALRYAVAEARRRGVPLYAVRAFGFQPPWFGPEVARIRDELRAEALRCVGEAFDLAMGQPPADVEVRVAVCESRVDWALVDVADRPDDVLVLGRRSGPVRLNWLVRGCLRRAVCPLVVVPPPPLAAVRGRRAVRRLMRELAGQPRPQGPTAIGRA